MQYKKPKHRNRGRFVMDDIKTRRITVALGADMYPVGELVFETDEIEQVSRFKYCQDWLNRPGAFALSPFMPLSESPIYGFADADDDNMRLALPGPISDTIPDYWGRHIIDHLLNFETDEFEYLIAINDTTRQGALRFLDEEGHLLSSSVPPIPESKNITRIMNDHRLLEECHFDKKDILSRIVGNSPGGARPKSDFNNHGNLSIAKFTSKHDILPVERMEVATLHLASRIGLRVAQADLLLANTDRPIAVLKRFDRIGERRIHYISAWSFTGHKEPVGAFYTDIVDKMRSQCGSAHIISRERNELYNRILFTILVSNEDDHLKNHGFIYAGNNAWILSPAFDINPKPWRSGYLETGISPLSGYRPSIEGAIEAAPFFNISEDDARNRVVDMAGQITDEWQGHCRNAGISDEDIRRYRPAFENEEMKLALGKLRHQPGIEMNMEP